MKRIIGFSLSCILIIAVLSSCSLPFRSNKKSSNTTSSTEESTSHPKGIFQITDNVASTTGDTTETTGDVINNDPPEPEAINSFTLEPIEWDTAVLGQIGLPDGYTYNSVIHNCDDTTCLGFPLRVDITAANNSEDVTMRYYCGEQYLQRVSDSSSLLPHNEGALDEQTAIFMRTYVDAFDYCNAKANGLEPGAVYVRDEDLPFYQGKADAWINEFNETITPVMESYGMPIDWVNMTAAQRLYSYDKNGVEYAMCVMASVRAYQYSMNAYGWQATNIIWDVPGYYILSCPMSIYENTRDNAFKIFTENTVVNDEFQDFNDQLTEQIRDSVISNMNMQVAASSAYMEAMTNLTFSMVENQMSYGSYSSDRFSDYIFDQNDYTLSDGTSVKISTSYDYVYEGDNGTVYYSNSAFDEPGGATRLYPNR